MVWSIWRTWTNSHYLLFIHKWISQSTNTCIHFNYLININLKSIYNDLWSKLQTKITIRFNCIAYFKWKPFIFWIGYFTTNFSSIFFDMILIPFVKLKNWSRSIEKSNFFFCAENMLVFEFNFCVLVNYYNSLFLWNWKIILLSS